MEIAYRDKSVEIEDGVVEGLKEYIDRNRLPALMSMRRCYSREKLPEVDRLMNALDRIELPADEKKEEWPVPGFTEDRGRASLSAGTDLDDFVRRRKKSFRDALFDMIDRSGKTDAEVYKRADIDRRLFSKIRSNADYHPNKRTALALALALELNIDETTDLIRRAGYALSFSNTADLIIRYCIENGMYDLIEVNALLYHYDQPLLGGQI